MTASIPFTKMSGSGNDFVVIDHRERLLAEDGIASFTRAVCRRRLSVGADGVILIELSDRPDADFRWRYFNADGSVGEMCGNGAMCGARFAVENGIAPVSCRFETEAGLVSAEVAVGADGRSEVSIGMPSVSAPNAGETVPINGSEWEVSALTVGVPHAVFVTDNVDALDNWDFDVWGRAVRYHPHFQPAGTNANLIHRLDGHTIRMRTWERGVEAETLACGTGAIASAIVAERRGLVTLPVEIVVSSGERLMVEFQNGGGEITDIRLRGCPRVVATGIIQPEALH